MSAGIKQANCGKLQEAQVKMINSGDIYSVFL